VPPYILLTIQKQRFLELTTLLLFLAYSVVAVGLIGWLWIVFLAFSEGETLWGIGCLLMPPLTVVYGFMNYQDAKIPFWIVTIGFGLNIAIRIIAATIGAVMAASA
jgi:hypothetical protein